VKNDIAGNFKQKISQEENAKAQSKYVGTKFQVAAHLQFGKADIDPIDIRDDVADEQKGNNPPGDPVIKRIVRVDRRDVRRGGTC
jgi:hypothetical protein